MLGGKLVKLVGGTGGWGGCEPGAAWEGGVECCITGEGATLINTTHN